MWDTWNGDARKVKEMSRKVFVERNHILYWNKIETSHLHMKYIITL